MDNGSPECTHLVVDDGKEVPHDLLEAVHCINVVKREVCVLPYTVVIHACFLFLWSNCC